MSKTVQMELSTITESAPLVFKAVAHATHKDHASSARDNFY